MRHQPRPSHQALLGCKKTEHTVFKKIKTPQQWGRVPFPP
ncbi:hypothetical protein POHY109586_10130 [Polaromonas hydrogenivorans]